MTVAWARTRLSQFSQANFNVKLLLAFTFFETAATSVAAGDILSAYLFLISRSNADVGYIQGVKGAAQLLLAGPAGWLADRWRRDRVLLLSAIIGALASAALAFAEVTGAALWTMAVAMAGLGAYTGASNPASESLFADSVQTGASAPLYTLKFVVGNVAAMCGPIFSIALFFWVGNVWEVHTCRTVVVIGLVMMAVPLALLLFADDDKCLGLSSESLHDLGRCQNFVQVPCAQSKWALFGSWSIPVLISISDLIGAFASGMTIKFIYLFFAEEVGLTPIAASSISVASPLCINLASLLLQRTSVWAGRTQVTLVSKVMDIVLMVAMARIPTKSGQPWLTASLVAVQLVRSAVANGSRPLMRSVLMDNVPKRMRARFNALESAKSFSWSGSAALGGVLIHRYGFQHTFLITAALRAVSLIILLPLLALVKDEVHRTADGYVTCTPETSEQIPNTATSTVPDVAQTLLIAHHK